MIRSYQFIFKNSLRQIVSEINWQFQPCIFRSSDSLFTDLKAWDDICIIFFFSPSLSMIGIILLFKLEVTHTLFDIKRPVSVLEEGGAGSGGMGGGAAAEPPMKSK